MSIVLGRPIRAKKQLICTGDEAKVSRIMSGRHKGMVERLQKHGPDATHSFHLRLKHGASSGSGHTPYNADFDYPIFKYLSLLLANRLFPDNFVCPHELRLSKDAHLQSAMYSPHVPDEGGKIPRLEESRARYYSSKARSSIKDEYDESERSQHPEIGLLADKISRAGITIAHPEANYHLSGGSIVFFETAGLDISKALEYVSENHEPAKNLLALTHLVALKSFALLLLKARVGNPYVRDWASTPLTELMRIFSSRYGESGSMAWDALSGRGFDVVKNSLAPFPEVIAPTTPEQPLPVHIDERIFDLL